MLTKRNASVAEATGRSLSYQGQQSTTRQMCLPVSASEDGRKIRQITKQNSFHSDQTDRYNGPQLIDRWFRNGAAPTAATYHSQDHRTKIPTASRLPAGGEGGPPPMSTSWTSGGGDGSSDDVPGTWRQFRNSDRSLRCSGQRLSSAKFASSIELSLDNEDATKGSEPHTSTLFASPTTGMTGRGGAVRGGGVGRVEGAETGRYFYPSSSPGAHMELARIFESPPSAGPPNPVRSSEGAREEAKRTLVLNGAIVLSPGPLETSTAGSYPELHNIALHESRRGSLPAPRKLDETSSTGFVRVRREKLYENSPPLSSNRHRNKTTLYRNSDDTSHQNGSSGSTFTTFNDGNSFKGSSDGISFLNGGNGKRFWSAHDSTAVSGPNRFVDGTQRENIYEEIDNSSLRSSLEGGNSAKQPPLPQTSTTATTTTDVVQSGGYRGPVMSLRLTPDQFTLSSSFPLSSRHRLFSSTRSINHQGFDDVLSQEYPNSRNKTQAPPVHPTVSAHPNPELRCHPRPYSRNPDDDVGTSRAPDRVPRGVVQGPLSLGVTSDGYLEPVTLSQPLDMTVARLEALLQEKDGERKRVQAAMEDMECCLIKQLRLEKRNSEAKLVELSEEWNRRLACHQQKAFRIEQSLLSQIYKLRTEKKTIKEQLDRLRLENQSLQSRVDHLENDLQTSMANETRLQVLNDEQQKELESLRVRLMDAAEALQSRTITNRDLNSGPISHLVRSPSETQHADEYRQLQDANGKEDEEKEDQEEEVKLRLLMTTNNEEAGKEKKEEDTDTSPSIRPNTASGSSYNDVIRRLEGELEETRSRLVEAEERMRTDQEQWLDEKKKVIAYQKQLQLNYIQIVQRNKTLQQETHQLALELERQHIRQVDAESATAPLANADETTCCSELTQAARTSTLTRST